MQAEMTLTNNATVFALESGGGALRGKSGAAPGCSTRSRAGDGAGEGPDGAGDATAVWRRQGQRLARSLSSSGGV